MMKTKPTAFVVAAALCALLMLSGTALAVAVAPGSITLESVSTEGEPSNSDNAKPSISADGRYIAFESAATNLVAGDTNNYRDIFLRDTVDGTTLLVSVAAAYGAYGYGANNSSYNPSISGTGQYVAFDSYASNLVAGGTSGCQVFLRDTVAGTTELVSVNAYGYGAASTSQDPSISFDGRYVAFESGDSTLADLAISTNNIYIRDRQAQTTTRILAYGGATPNAGLDNPAMSGDGSAVAFQSTATNLLAADNPGGVSNIFVYDTASGAIDLISRAYVISTMSETSSYGANSGCEAPAISYGGRYVAFLSAATNLIYGAGNGNSQVYVYDRTTGEMVIASAEDDGTDEGNNSSYTPHISDDGRYVTFGSSATNLTPMENAGTVTAVYLRDLVDRKTTLISRVDNDLAGYETGVYGAHAYNPVVSACGMYVAFASPKGGYLAEVSSDIFRAINDTNGDGIADTDADGDGTPDCVDLCPDDPDKIEPGACGCGVADTDTDGDGTPDCLEEAAAPLLPDTETQTEDTSGTSCFISTTLN